MAVSSIGLDPNERVLRLASPPMRPGLIALIALTLLAAGCGNDSSEGAKSPQLSLALDFTPNAAHAPIYENVADFNARTVEFLKRHTGPR